MSLKTEKEQLHKCKVCDKTFATERSLHAHLKAHKLRLAEYYQTYYPRYDKHDGNIIKFESWGLMNLSYLIKKNKKGNYLHFKIEGNGKTIKEF